jgi:hypothetical protein
MEPVPAPPSDPAPIELAAPAAPASVGLTDAPPEERLHLARERARHGDFAGARLLLEPLLDDPAPHGFTARYLDALALEFDGRAEDALVAYDALMAEDPTADVRFRRAETLARLDRYDEARAALAALPGANALAPTDAVKVAALEAAWDVRRGKVKRGERHLRRLVAEPASEEPTAYLAIARLTLLELATDRAEVLAFDGSDRERARNLQRRAALVLEAEQELAALIRLGETRAALDGFVAVAETYRDLGDDLHAEPIPGGLTEAQAAVYRDELGKRVAQVWAKSTLYCDKGLEYAARQDWTGAPVAELTAQRALAASRVDGSAP